MTGTHTMPDETPDDRRPERPESGPEKEPLHKLTLGRTASSPDRPHAGPPVPRDTLPTLAARCRAKAEAARWAAERERRLRERDEHADDDAPADPALREWAGALTDAFYWASAESKSDTPDVSALDLVGGAFETLAEALRLVQDSPQRRGGPEKALPLLAEAQSAARRALRRLRAPDDPDQLAAYEATRALAAQHRVFLKRFMRADDLADPAGWPALLDRIEALTGHGARSQRQGELLARLRSQLLALDEGTDRDATWPSIMAVVDQIVDEGTPPSNPELRALLLPHIDELPAADDLPTGCRLVLRAIDRDLATRPAPPAQATPDAPTVEVRKAARLLAGRSAVLIGGMRRPQAQELLRAALGLESLVWIGTREHQPIRRFEAAIARPEVAVVLLAIRWSSHAFGDVKAFCDRHGKPLVRLPGGYNATQVAAQIIAQCGDRLAD